MAFDPRSNLLAVLGEGSKSKVLPGLSLALWSAQGPQLKLMSSLGMAGVGAGGGACTAHMVWKKKTDFVWIDRPGCEEAGWRCLQASCLVPLILANVRVPGDCSSATRVSVPE